jgi:hypothetical protein
MDPVEHDVYVCYRYPSGLELAKEVTAGLRRRGFRVFVDERAAGSVRDERALRTIEETPDFVLLLTPGALDACVDEGDPMRVEIAHAVGTDRSIVPVFARGYTRPAAAALSSDLVSLHRRQGVSYDPEAQEESVALIAHMLSSDASVDDRRLMRQAKWVGWMVAAILVVVVGFPTVQAISKMLARKPPPAPLPPLVLYWSGFGQRLDDGRWVEFPIEDGAAMLGGDQVRLVFSPGGDGFAYVIARDVRGEIAVLFPARTLASDSRVLAGELYEAPVDGSWFAPEDSGGVQALYVIASYDPVENLESLVEERPEEASPQARRVLLESTLTGLVDGRHSAVTMGVRTRVGRPIVKGTETTAPTISSASTTLASGAVVTHRLTAEQGLLSAVAEIRVRYQPAR